VSRNFDMVGHRLAQSKLSSIFLNR
jgi:hypothetical protein